MLTAAILLTMLMAQPPVFTACRMDSQSVIQVDTFDFKIGKSINKRWYDANGVYHIKASYILYSDPNKEITTWEAIVNNPKWSPD